MTAESLQIFIYHKQPVLSIFCWNKELFWQNIVICYCFHKPVRSHTLSIAIVFLLKLNWLFLLDSSVFCPGQ